MEPKFHLNTSSGFQNLSGFTQPAINKFPQSILQWGFHTIFTIDLGFQSREIQL